MVSLPEVTKMKTILSALIGLAMLGITSLAAADELIMIHNPSCPYCQAFMKEVYPTYQESKIGQTLPLVVFNTKLGHKDPNYTWIKKAGEEGRFPKLQWTPTFIIWVGDHETGMSVGHWSGYGGSDKFYATLETLREVTKVPKSE